MTSNLPVALAEVDEGGLEALPEGLQEVWHDYRRSLARKGRSTDTVHLYQRTFVAFWRWAIEAGVEPNPAAVTARTINTWTDHLLTAPAVRNGRKQYRVDPETGEQVPKLLEASTRRIMFRNLRPFFSWYAKDFDAPNPFDRADPPGDDRPAPIPVVAVDDLRRLVAACSGRTMADRRDLAIMLVLITTGARLGELVALRTEDWDPRTDRLVLRGKTGTREVSLHVRTSDAISRYVRERRRHQLAGVPALWLAPKRPLTPSGVAQMLARRCDEAGVERINPHRFRHTWAHQFRALGGSEGDLLQLAGWTSTAMAHRYGRSAAAERAQEASKRYNVAELL